MVISYDYSTELTLNSNILVTVEPPHNGHMGTEESGRCREVAVVVAPLRRKTFSHRLFP